MINPDYAQVTPVTWTLAVQDDGTSLNSTETFRPDGVITAEPMDDSENIGAGSGLVSLYRQKRTLHMVGGQLYGDLPADLEGTGWTWKITATLRWTNGQGVARTRVVGPFYVVAKTTETVDLAEAAKGQLTGNVWTTQGREGVSVTTISLAAGNVLRTTLSDGRVINAGTIDLSGVTATASLDTLQGASPLGKELVAAETQEAARARIGAGTSNVKVGPLATDAKPGDYQPTAATITDATATGRSLLTATDADAARTLIGAGTGTVKTVNNTTPDANGNVTVAAGASIVASTGITDSTSVGRSVLTAADAPAARTAIGAGTSSLALGTTASTAKAGNYQPTAANITDATATGRAIVKAPAGTVGQVLSTNGDGTVAWIAAPTGGGSGGTPTVTTTSLDALMGA